jgi:large subunit ribosomal protein L16
MLYTPKKTKYKKQRKGRLSANISKNNNIDLLKQGTIGLKLIDFGRIKVSQLIACRQVLRKIMKKHGIVTINIVADTPITKKPIEIRMGKGKGAVDHWVAKVHPGTILVEIETGTKILAIKALKAAQLRLPLKTKIIFE